ncbi:MAG TPA: FliH/SctL family protein [Chloroflexota bacterium]|nr:FliH/SctL family protein [Chloroflexota bacterium]
MAAASEAARQRGFEQAQAQAHALAAEAIERERSAVGKAVEEFAAERQRYFHRVEGDVVKLALAIARKILHREAQIDPLLLAGAVRVALEKMEDTSRIVLHVPQASVAAWKAFCTAHASGMPQVEVVADETLGGNRCRLEAESGRAEFDLEAQLGEIESGFFDLLNPEEGAPQ